MTGPIFETQRLTVRLFAMDDLDAIHQLLDFEVNTHGLSREQRTDWLRWTVLNDNQLAEMHQPPYGDRAVVLKHSGILIGSVGLVPTLAPYDQLPYFNPQPSPATRYKPEVGLYYAFSLAYQ